MNSPGWTDDSHVLVGMGWISNTIWFIAQSFVEQLHLERLDTLHVSACCSLVPSMTVRHQSRRAGQTEEQKNLCQASPGWVLSSPWYQYKLPPANWLLLAVRSLHSPAPSPGAGGWRCEGSAPGLCFCLWWWLGHQLDICYCPCVTWGWLCPSAVEIYFLPPCISQAFPGDLALHSTTWPWSQSYYYTLFESTDICIYAFLLTQLYVFRP